MFCSISYRNCTALGESEQRKSIETSGVDNRFHVAEPRIERYFADVPIRETVAARIVTNKRKRFCEVEQPMAENRKLPIIFQMPHPVSRPHQRWTGPDVSIGKANAVRRGAIPNVLLEVGFGQDPGCQRSFAVNIDVVDFDRPRDVLEVLTAKFTTREFNLAFEEIEHVTRD